MAQAQQNLPSPIPGKLCTLPDAQVPKLYCWAWLQSLLFLHAGYHPAQALACAFPGDFSPLGLTNKEPISDVVFHVEVCQHVVRPHQVFCCALYTTWVCLFKFNGELRFIIIIAGVPGVLHCGWHDVRAIAAASYLVLRPEGNILVDVPRCGSVLQIDF
eukprot:scaffold84583_cov22-Tisochrysis_lutea.AAC.1